MKVEKILKICIIFLFGFLSANLISYYLVYGVENPFSNGFGLSSTNHAPSDFVKENQISVYDDKVVINLNNTRISRYASTGSMKPILDENSNGIEIVPTSENQINIGDIITFEQNGNLIVHRVIEKGSDEFGTYFITKGDSNTISDGKIRFKDIKYITIGIIW
jgi:signal peptidase I